MGDSTIDSSGSPQRMQYTGLHELFRQRQLEAKIWIEEVINERVIFNDNLGTVLKDGRILCKLINGLYPGCVGGWYESDPVPKLKMVENINLFLQRCRNIGVPEDKIFSALDLVENKNLPLVVDCIAALQLIFETTPPPNNINNNHNGSTNHSNGNTSSNTTGYFSGSTTHTLPPNFNNFKRSNQTNPRKGSLFTGYLTLNNIVRFIVLEFRDHMLVPFFIGTSAGMGLSCGRLLYIKTVGLCCVVVGKVTSLLVGWKLKT